MKTIPLIKPYLPDIDRLRSLLENLYETRVLTHFGCWHEQFAQKLRAVSGVENVFPCSNGTLALKILVESVLGSVRNGSRPARVLISDFGWAATPNVVSELGHIPVFYRPTNPSLGICPSALRDILIKYSIDCVLPTVVFGNPQDVKEVASVCEEFDVPCIFDAAHGLGARCVGGHSILKFGLGSTVSFHPTKLLNVGSEGGAIFCNDSQLTDKIQRAIYYGITDKNITSSGLNYKLGEFECGVGALALENLDTVLAAREQIFEFYAAHIFETQDMRLYSHSLGSNYSYAPLVFSRLDSIASTEALLNSSGVTTRRYFGYSLRETDLYRNHCLIEPSVPKRRSGGEWPSNHVLCLPSFFGMTPTELARVSDLVNSSNEV